MQKKQWSNAKKTACTCGRTHPSKMEAMVCARLRIECVASGLTLYQQPRFALWSLAPDETGKPAYISVDFALVDRGQIVRVIDAKSPTRVSREWRRGALAFESAYGLKIECVDS